MMYLMLFVLSAPPVLYTDLPNRITEPTKVSVGKVVEGFTYTPTNPFLDDGQYWATMVKGKLKTVPYKPGSKSVDEVVKEVESGKTVIVTVGDGTLIGDLVGAKNGVYPPGVYELSPAPNNGVNIKPVVSNTSIPSCPDGRCPLQR